MSIVVIGSVFVDIKGYPLEAFIAGGRNMGRIEQVHGGVCRNVAENIANLELRPIFVSLVDESGTGRDVIEKLERHKVDTRYIRRTPEGMGTWLAVFDSDYDVTAAISARPDLMPIATVLDEQGDEIFARADSILFELDMDKEIVKRIFALAKKYNTPLYAVVSNMRLAIPRRDFLTGLDCFVCNKQEAGILFSEDFESYSPAEMAAILADRIENAGISRMVVTLGADGAVYAEHGSCGLCPAWKVDVQDTTGAGDAFFSGVAVGLTYGKSLAEACAIGTKLSASVIVTTENVCPRFRPEEFGLPAVE